MALISGSGRRLPAFADYQRFILEHYDAKEVPISAFSHSLDRMLRFNCFHSVDNRPRRSMDDFVFTAYLLPRTPRNEELYERPWNGKKPHYVVLEQLLGAVDTSCAKLSLLCISPWHTREVMRANPRAIKSISVPWRHWKKASIKISKKACFSSGNLIEYQC